MNAYLKSIYQRLKRAPLVIPYSIGTEQKYIKLVLPYATYYGSKNEFARDIDLDKLRQALAEEVKEIGINKLITYAKKLNKEKSKDVEKYPTTEEELKEHLDTTPISNILLALVFEYSAQHPKHKVNKKVARDLSRSTELSLQNTDLPIATRDIFGGRTETLNNKVIYPRDWGVDERILLYDVILKEYYYKPRTKIALIRGKRIIEVNTDKVIVVDSKAIRKHTGFNKSTTITRILKKFSRLLQEIQVNLEIRYIKGQPYLVSGKTTILKPYESSQGFTGLVLSPISLDDIGQNISFYEFSRYAQNYWLKQQLQGGEYSLVEARLFSRLKESIPTKSQNTAARLLEKIIERGTTAYISLEEIATLLGKYKKFQMGIKSQIIDEINSILDAMQAGGVIYSYHFLNNGVFEIKL